MKAKTIIFISSIVIIIAVSGYLMVQEGKENTRLETLNNLNLNSQSSPATIEIDRINRGGRDLDYVFDSDGFIRIISNGKERSKMGFAIQGNGETKTSSDFTWTINKTREWVNTSVYHPWNETFSWWDESGYWKYNITLDNNNPSFNWKINLAIDKKTKITHIITNNRGETIRNTKFWYLYTLPRNSKVWDGSKFITGSLDNPINREGNFNNYTELRINGFTLKLDDLVESGATISNFYLGNGQPLGYPNKLFLGIGVTKGNGNFRDGVTVSLDPTTTSFSTGIQSGIPRADFSNSGNAGASDNNYATTTTAGNNLSISNFSMLESEGGEVPDDAIIQGFQFEIEATTSGGGSARLFGDMSPDWGTTILSSDSNYKDIETPEGFWPYGSSSMLYNRRWAINEISNDNLQIIARSSDPIDLLVTLKIDSARLKITYTTAAVNNITERPLNGTTWYWLPLSEEPSINFNSTIYHYSFDEINFATSNRTGNKGLYDFFGGVMDDNRTGIIGQSVYFSSSPNTQFKPGAIDLIETKQNITLAGWVYFDANSGQDYIYDKSIGAAATNFAWRLYRGQGGANTDKIIFQLKNASLDTDSIFSPCRTTGTIPDGEWHHVAATYNGTTREIYIDGVLDRTCTNIVGDINNVGVFHVGTRSDEHNSFDMIGRLDEMFILDSTLNSSDILDLFNNGTVKQFYPSGFWEFKNKSIGGNNTLNLTLNKFSIPGGSSLNVSIGNSSGGTYVYGEEYDISSGTVNNLSVGTPINYSIKIIAYAGMDNFITPSWADDFNEVGWIKSAFDDCVYDASTNPTINNSLNCGGENFTCYNLGNVTIKGNITNFYQVQILDGCKLNVEGIL